MVTATVQTAAATRLLRTVRTQLVSAAATALKRMGASVRAKYIAALTHLGSRDVGPLPPFDLFWWVRGAGRGPAASDMRPGDLFANRRIWRIDAPAPGVVRLDVVPRLRPLLERWQYGGGERPDRLRSWVRTVSADPRGRAYYHARLIPAGWPRLSDLPPVPDQPPREIAAPLSRAVAPHLRDWFARALEKILQGRAERWTRRIAA